MSTRTTDPTSLESNSPEPTGRDLDASFDRKRPPDAEVPVAPAGTTEFQGRLLDIAAGIGLFWGTTLTLILAATYLPNAIWLNARIRELRMPPGDPQGDREAPASADQGTEEVPVRFGLGQTVFSQVTQLLAILSPMISGALPFLGNLTQALG